MSTDFIYKKMTATIVKAMTEAADEGRKINWMKPWTGQGPTSLSTGKPYGFINSLVLEFVRYESKFTSNKWGTFNAIRSLGGMVKKGAHSTMVALMKRNVEVSVEPDENGEPKEIRRSWFTIRYFNVFNLNQTTLDAAKFETANDNPAIVDADRIIDEMPGRPEIVYGGGRACYNPPMDTVSLPTRESFKTSEHFYSTAFHELAHATGHTSRLNRKAVNDPIQFGSHAYSDEELVAELAASFLMDRAGLATEDTLQNSVEYLRGWASKLTADPKLIFVAAPRAAKAADYILNTEADAEDVAEGSEEAKAA